MTEVMVADLVERKAVDRLFGADHTLWRDDPTEIADRLGWIPVVAELQAALPALQQRVDRLADGIDHVVVMGMGGSSLFPEVLARTFEPAPGRPRLHVLDTTHPATIARVASQCPPEHTLFLASSKSGSTIETRSHLEWAWAWAEGESRFAVVTDPGSELGALARQRGFAEVFENRADIGGRYSALSLFGVVPALLMGIDAEALLAGGAEALAACGPDVDPSENPAVQLAAAAAAGVGAGRDKLTFLLPESVATFGLWLEQLVAESLGKDGTGVVPIVGELGADTATVGDDRLFVASDGIDVTALVDAGHPAVTWTVEPDPRSIGHAVVLAEVAVALMGAAIGVQPFDQPDVAAAKGATIDVLEDGDTTVEPTPLAGLLEQLEPGDHLALQAFVDPEGDEAAVLVRARAVLRSRHRVAVSLGFGPRFLHSTGQLHKGGPDAIVCVQVLDVGTTDVPIPVRQPQLTFGELLAAQAAGDLRALQKRGRVAGRVELAELLAVAEEAGS
ncbi:MAG: glucose-6-phosphate isomerase [Actinomycetota bacterium]|nr:glucose-6-phosphate isomerase [Actinomycetota bacterium]